MSDAKPKLIRGRDDQQVWLIEEGHRRWVPDGPTVESLGGWDLVDQSSMTWQQVAETFAPAPPVQSVTEGPSPWRVRVKGTDDYYLIASGRRRPLRKAVAWDLIRPEELDLFPPSTAGR